MAEADGANKEVFTSGCRAAHELAVILLQVFPPVDVAGVMQATAIDVMVNLVSKDAAVNWLRDLADALERDEYRDPTIQ